MFFSLPNSCYFKGFKILLVQVFAYFSILFVKTYCLLCTCRSGKPGPLKTESGTTASWPSGRRTVVKRLSTTKPKRPRLPNVSRRKRPRLARPAERPRSQNRSRSLPLRPVQCHQSRVEPAEVSRAKSSSRTRIRAMVRALSRVNLFKIL